MAGLRGVCVWVGGKWVACSSAPRCGMSGGPVRRRHRAPFALSTTPLHYLSPADRPARQITPLHTTPQCARRSPCLPQPAGGAPQHQTPLTRLSLRPTHTPRPTPLGRAPQVSQSIQVELPYDCWTIDLRAAAIALGEVSGDEVAEEVLDSVFSRWGLARVLACMLASFRDRLGAMGWDVMG